MRLHEPRIPPVDEAEADEETRALLERSKLDGRILHVHATIARHPKLLKRWLVFGAHVLRKSTLPERDREILILRIGWLCRAEYEWSAHSRIARMAGLSDEEIERIARGPDAEGWAPFDSALLRAVDELHGDAFVSDATWKALCERYDTRQLMDLVFTVGQYNLVSMALNSFGVQPEEGAESFPVDTSD